MSNAKEFFELLSRDERVQLEAANAAVEALADLLAAKGFKEDAQKAADETLAKVAEAHGFKFEQAEELSPEELESVAGGRLCIAFIDRRNRRKNNSLFGDKDSYDDELFDPVNNAAANKYSACRTFATM